MLKSDFRKKGVYSKTVTKTLYRNKFLVSKYIFKLTYHCEASRWSEICCARDIRKKPLDRLLLLLILKSSYSGCTVEKGTLKNFTNFTQETSVLESFLNKNEGVWAFNFIKKRFQRGCFSMKFANLFRTTILKNIWERLLLYLHVILFTRHEKY